MEAASLPSRSDLLSCSQTARLQDCSGACRCVHITTFFILVLFCHSAFPFLLGGSQISTRKTTLRFSSPQANYRPIDSHLLPKLVTTFTDRGCQVVRLTDSYSRILGFLDRSRYFCFQAAPQLYSRGWVDPVTDPLLLRKCGNAGNRTRISGSVTRNSDH
jgi:hypothetical protein